MSDFMIDELGAKYNVVQDVTDTKSASGSESPVSSTTASSVTSTPDDSSNPEAMKHRYMPKIPEDHEAECEGYSTWRIDSWKDLKDHKVSGPKFKIGDYEWNLLVFPKGNGGNHLSIYLKPNPPMKVVDEEGDSNLIDITDGETSTVVSDDKSKDDVEFSKKEVPLDPNWHVCAQFVIDIWNPKYPDTHKHNVSQHRFSSEENDWGFGNFVELNTLHSTTRLNKHPFINDNKVNFTVYIRIVRDHTGCLWHNFVNYDSKKETGFVGINNQGATCYLNSLLQSYYFTKLFRKKVYQIPTQDENVKLDTGEEVAPDQKSVSLALQRLFYRLQTSDDAIDTNELTASFGWDPAEAFTQHDVQEMNRILMDRLENKMKGTSIEGCLSDIFVGKMKSFIRCINVDYESSRSEDFWDIQLNVKGMRDLRESFANYIELETLTGENQYDASGFGLQDAEKGVVFESFPPVLHLQLKRFEYDFNYDQLVKVNDRHEFLDSIDLKPYLDQSSTIVDQDWIYDLHGVLVHTGDISTGHYYALIRPSEKNEWFRFDDDRVWKVTPHAVFEENFGCDRKSEAEIRAMTRAEQYAYQNRRHTSAYMLVYIRRSHQSKILAEVENADIPAHVPEQVDKEEKEKERIRIEREEMHLYANFRLITNKTFMNYQGFDLTPDEHSKLYYATDLYDDESYSVTCKILKSAPARELFDVISGLLDGLDPQYFRLWTVINRKNSTVRAELPVEVDVAALDQLTIQNIIDQKTARRFGFITLYVEEINKGLKCVAKSIIDAAKGDVANDQFDVSVLAKQPDVDSTTLVEHFTNVSAAIPKEKYPPAFVKVDVDSQDIVLFLKYYDPVNSRLQGVTHVIVNRDSYTGSLVKYIQVLMNWSFDTEVVLYEEIQPNSIELIDQASSFERSELLNGDIICFAKASYEVAREPEIEFASAASFYKFLAHRVHLYIKPLQQVDEDTGEFAQNSSVEKPTDEMMVEIKREFDLWVVASITFKELAAKISSKIQVDPAYIRVFGVYSNDNRVPISSHTHLLQLLPKNVPQANLFNFEYEILKIPLQELENMEALKIYWLSSGVVHCQKHELLIPKSGLVKDLMEKIANKFKMEDAHSKENIFIYTTMENRISHVLSPDLAISSVDSSRFTIYAGCYPELYAAMGGAGPGAGAGAINVVQQKSEEERLAVIKKSIDAKIVQSLEKGFPTKLSDVRTTFVFQFYKDFHARHGIPFVFIMIKGEKFKQTKLRLQQQIGLGTKEFAKVRVAVSPAYGEWKPRYLADDESELFDELEDVDHLALDHPDRSARRGSNFERAIFIKD